MRKYLLYFFFIPTIFYAMESQESKDLHEEMLTLDEADIEKLITAKDFFPFPSEIVGTKTVDQKSSTMPKMNRSEEDEEIDIDGDDFQILYYSFCRFCSNYIYNRSLNNKQSFEDQCLSKHKRKCREKSKFPHLRDMETIEEKTIPKTVKITKRLRELRLAYDDGEKIIISKKLN